jgi:hypothetical protein
MLLVKWSERSLRSWVAIGMALAVLPMLGLRRCTGSWTRTPGCEGCSNERRPIGASRTALPAS